RRHASLDHRCRTLHMQRRDFILGLGGAVMSPVVVRAQEPEIPGVVLLHGGSAADYAPQIAAFLEGLREAGHVEGKNFAIEYRWADGDFEKLATVCDRLC